MLAVLFLVLFFVGEPKETEAEVESDAPVDAYAGGFPVPPMPAGGAVRGPAAPLTFGTGEPVTASTAAGEEN